jgi:hypothetical protein
MPSGLETFDTLRTILKAVRMRLALPLCLLALFALPACGGGEPAAPTTAPPVIVVQPPSDTAGGGGAPTTTGSDYAGMAWEKAGAPGGAEGEPADVVALLREYEAELTDPPGDATGDAGYDDLLSALVAVDAKYLYGRVLTQESMSVKEDRLRELRFWLEQAGKMVTVEVKVGTRGAPCELIDAASGGDEAKIVEGCFWLGNAIDIRIPLDAIPATINVTKPFWASGFQTCCADEARNEPFDTLEEAQQVWRVPGLADKKDSVDEKPYSPGAAKEGEAPNVP